MISCVSCIQCIKLCDKSQSLRPRARFLCLHTQTQYIEILLFKTEMKNHMDLFTFAYYYIYLKNTKT